MGLCNSPAAHPAVEVHQEGQAPGARPGNGSQLHPNPGQGLGRARGPPSVGCMGQGTLPWQPG